MAHRQYSSNAPFSFMGAKISEVIDLEGSSFWKDTPGFHHPEYQLLKLASGRVVLAVKVDRGERKVEELGKTFRVCELYGIDITDQLAGLWPVLNRWATER